MPNPPSTWPFSFIVPITSAGVTDMPRLRARAPTIAANTACTAWSQARITSRLCIKRRPVPPGPSEQIRKDALGNPLPELSYAVTFFPEVQKMSDAVAVKIAPGDEVAGIDIFLTLVHTVHVRGRVLSAAKDGVIAQPQRDVANERLRQYRLRQRSHECHSRQGSELRDRRRDRRALFIDWPRVQRMASGLTGRTCLSISAMRTSRTRISWSARRVIGPAKCIWMTTTTHCPRA